MIRSLAISRQLYCESLVAFSYACKIDRNLSQNISVAQIAETWADENFEDEEGTHEDHGNKKAAANVAQKRQGGTPTKGMKIQDEDEEGTQEDHGNKKVAADVAQKRRSGASTKGTEIQKKFRDTLGEAFCTSDTFALVPVTDTIGRTVDAGGEFPNSLFPWKGFPKLLGDQGYVCHGWPHKMPMPGDDQAGKSKGVAGLKIVQAECIMDALQNEQHLLQFLLVPESDKKGWSLNTRHIEVFH